MSHINYPLVDNQTSFVKSSIFEKYPKRSSQIVIETRSDETKILVLNGKIGGKIKFVF